MDRIAEFKRRIAERERAHAQAERARIRAALTGTAAEQKAADARAARTDPIPGPIIRPDHGPFEANLTPVAESSAVPNMDGIVP